MNYIAVPVFSTFYREFPQFHGKSDHFIVQLTEATDLPVRNGVAFISYDLKEQILKGSPLMGEHLRLYSFGKVLDSQQVRTDQESRKPLIKPQTDKRSYLEHFKKLQEHIHRGDIYEVNYCIEFKAENCSINPWDVFDRFSSLSEAPFSFLSKTGDEYILCSSPERFLKKTGPVLFSQPIKGTRKRDPDPQKDRALIEELKTDPKERSENIMIVDLVRNDLSRLACRGSVKVEELCGIYSFKQVHQMISTISCRTEENDLIRILEATFPMGSMTGAPKIRAMELIEEHETFDRDIYSGSVGIIKENGDFDLNVIIRSIIYNERKRYLSFAVGSAITAEANAESEYEECLLKAKAMFIALGCEDQWNKLANA